jgi:chromosome segregation ATPase
MRVAAFLLCGWSCVALTLQTEANPIRKIVTLLQDMQAEITAEGEKEKKLYDKFMCYCEGNTDGMSKSAEEAAQRITELKAKLEAETAEKTGLDQELMQHKQDREAAQQDLAKAESLRAKEKGEYEVYVGEARTNIEAMTGAVAALEKGMGRTFLQSKDTAARVRKIAASSPAVDDYQRSTILSFLGQNPFGDYSSQSGEIVGILKTMKDDMDKDLNGAISTEEEAAKSHEGLVAAKKSEITAASQAIEAKTKRTGGLAVSIVTTSGDIKDTTSELDDTQAFLANLASECASKKSEWDERSKMRAEEVSAISMAIKVLNDDDALDLFKKTLSLTQDPAQQSKTFGFLQKATGSSRAQRALDALAKIAPTDASSFGLLQFTLGAKKVDFTKVLAMIDGMVIVLKEEQKNDDAQKAFCDKDLDSSAAQKKDTEEAIEASEALIEETKESAASLAEEVATLQKEIVSLDKAVAEATEQRKEEHSDALQFQTENNAALQLIEKAKNRLLKFYRPTEYKAPPKQELTDEEKILASSGRSDLIATDAPEMIMGTTQTVYVQVAQKKDTPAPPPETWGAYQKKDGKSNGVMALMDRLAADLAAEMKEAQHEEETSQKDYERLMADSQASRAQKAEGITRKSAAKADLDVKVQNTAEALDSQNIDLQNVQEYIVKLHSSCDFLIQNYDLRKAARSNELDSLANAKSVLSGANFS